MAAKAPEKNRAVLRPVAFSFASLVLFTAAFLLLWREVESTVLLILCGFGALSGVWGFFVELNRRCWPGLGLNVTSLVLNAGLGALVSLAIYLRKIPISFL